MPNNPYTEYELEILRKIYPSGGVKECQKYINRSRDSIRHTVLNHGISRDKGWNLKKDYYDLFDFNPINCYLLGLIWADGAIRMGRSWAVIIGLKEDDFFEIKQIFNEKWRVRERICKNYPKSWKPFWFATHESKILLLKLLECDYGNKSIAAPSKILNIIPDDLKHYFWRGYFDGDGSVRRSLNFAGAFETDWSEVIKLMENLSLDYSISKRTHKNMKSSVFYIIGKNKTKFLEYISQGESFGLGRKRTLFKKGLPKMPKSQYAGVSLLPNGKFLSRITFEKEKYRKIFDTEIEAAKYYDDLAKRFSPQNRRKLNFPE